MRARLVAPFLAATLALGSAACIRMGDAETRNFEKDYPVKGPVTLDIQNGSGDVTISPGTAGRVRIRGEVRMYEHLFATGTRRGIDEITSKPPISQTGDILRIVRPQPDGMGGVTINYTIEVPTNTEVRLANGSGDVQVTGIDGPVRVETRSGDVQVVRIQQRADVIAGSGDIVVRDVSGPLVVNARSGGLEIESIRGDIRAETGSGDIRITRPGGRIQARANSGDIEVDGISADLRIHTGSGDCHIAGNPAPSSSWEIETRSGEAVLDVPERASFQVLARGRGDIDTEIAMNIEEKTRRQLRGRVGKGEARVTVETGSGRIRIH